MVREIWTVSQHLVVKVLYGRVVSDMVFVIQGSLRPRLRSQMRRMRSRVK